MLQSLPSIKEYGLGINKSKTKIISDKNALIDLRIEDVEVV